MTGKDLILYILQNNLENEVVLENGVFLGFINEGVAAAKFEVGVETIKLWFSLGLIKGFQLGNTVYLPRDIKDPRKGRDES